MNITEASKDLFLQLAKDAPNWNGTPMIDISKEQRGNLTQLKRAGLLTTQVDDGIQWAFFTNDGKAFALENGVEV